MKIEIKDNFLEKDLITFLYNHFLTIPHFFIQKSSHKNSDESTFYISNLDIRNNLYQYLSLKIIKLFSKPILIENFYINVQHNNMNGSFHKDPPDTTVLLMVSPTLGDNSGCFEIKENNKKLKKINFVQNRLIIFPALWEHRGLAPIEKNKTRITLAFKTKKII